MTDDDIIERVLTFEGGFVNNPQDRGGPTNFGITAAVLGRVRNLGRPATAAEIQALTRDEAVAIYKASYIATPKFDQIADGNLRLIVVDSGVLHGTDRATRWLQTALAVAADGIIGTNTIAALNQAGVSSKAGQSVLAQRFKFIGNILTSNPSQVEFASGWLNRVADLLDFA